MTTQVPMVFPRSACYAQSRRGRTSTSNRRPAQSLTPSRAANASPVGLCPPASSSATHLGELILGRSEKFPPVLVQLHSAYMHSIGIDRALDLMEALLRHEVFAGAYRLNVSRIDIYTDYQGWVPQVTDP